MAYIIQPYSDDTGRNCPESYLAIGDVTTPDGRPFVRKVTLNRYMSKAAADAGYSSFSQEGPIEITVDHDDNQEYVNPIAAALPGATVVNE
jgi:hypothetical protein